MSEKYPGFITTLEAEGTILNPEQQVAVKEIAKTFFGRSAGIKMGPDDLREFLYGPPQYISESYETRLEKWREARLVELEAKRKSLLTESARLDNKRAQFEADREAASEAMKEIRAEIFKLEKISAREDEEGQKPRRRRTGKRREIVTDLGEQDDESRLAEQDKDVLEPAASPSDETEAVVPEVPVLTLEELGKQYDEIVEQTPKIFDKLVKAPIDVPSHLREAAEAIVLRITEGADKSFETLTRGLSDEEPARDDPNYRFWLEGQLNASVRRLRKYEEGLKEIDELVSRGAAKRQSEMPSTVKIPDRINLQRAVASREREIEELMDRALEDVYLSSGLTSSQLEKKWYNRPGLAELYEKAHAKKATLEDLGLYLKELEKYLDKLRKLLPREFPRKK